MTLTCDDFDNGIVNVEVYFTIVRPDGTMSQSFCSVLLTVQNNSTNPNSYECNNVVGDGMAFISGAIMTDEEDMVESVTVSLDGSDFASQETGDEGLYSFPEMSLGGDYTVVPKSEVDPLNGVSTLDLVLIQKHVLGLDALTDPYKILAADINKSGSVTASDIVQLRQLILGITENLPQDESWRFVGYKVGDVSGDAVSNSNLLTTEIREIPKVKFEIDDTDVSSGEEVRVVFRASEDMKNVYGWQFSLSHTGMILAGVESGEIEIDEQMLAMNIREDLSTMSWHDQGGKVIRSGSELFTLVFVSDQEVKLSESLVMNSRLTSNEMYIGSDYEKYELGLVIAGEEAFDFAIQQNVPNPWKESTTIEFVIPRSGQVGIKMLTVLGETISNTVRDFERGVNNLTIAKNEVPQSGIVILELSYGQETRTIRMLLLE